MRRRRGSGEPIAVEILLRLSPKALWAEAKRQPTAFWFLCAYVMIEYVRPQQVWPQIDFLPWGQVTLAGAALSLLGTKWSRIENGSIDIALAVFSAIVLLSIMVSPNSAAGFDKIDVPINWLLLYFLTTRIVKTGTQFLLFFLAYLLWSLKMSQHGARDWIQRGFAFADYGATGAPGWFQNSGEFAIQMCIFLPMCLHFILAMRKTWPKRQTNLLLLLLPGTAILSVLASSTRGGQLGAAAVLVFVTTQSRYRFRGIFLIALCLPLLWMALPERQRARFAEAGEDKTSESRLTYWKDGLRIIEANPVLGVGYMGWTSYYRQYLNPTGGLPHNIFIEVTAETGYLGLAGFLTLIVLTFVTNYRTRRLPIADLAWERFFRSTTLGLDAALIGYLVSGFFVTVFWYPFFWMNLTFTATLHQVARNHRGLPPSRSLRPDRRAVSTAALGGGPATPLAPGYRPRGTGRRLS